MSKKSGYILASIFVSLLVLSLFVSAQAAPPVSPNGFNNANAATGNTAVGQKTATIMSGIIDFLNVLLTPILGNSSYGGHTQGEVLLMRALIFVIIITILMVVLRMIPIFQENGWANFILSIGAAILVTRFMLTPAWIETIFLPWTAMGIAMSAFLPLIIYFYFMNTIAARHRTLRKIGWVFAGVVFAVLFFIRAGEIQTLVGDGFNPAYIYLIAAAACAALLFMDKTIQKAFKAEQVRDIVDLGNARMKVELVEEVDKLKTKVSRGNPKIDSPEYKLLYDDLKDRLKVLNTSDDKSAGEILINSLPKPRAK